MEAARHHLIGRDEVLARISTALGSGVSVLLRGDPGIGKTALLQALAASPEALSVTGTGDLPLSAFAHLGDTEWRQPTPTGIAAALYRTTVRSGTSLLVVDDAHWLDPASAGLVLQLARSGTRMLAAARSGVSIPRAIQAVIRQGGETIEVGELSIDSVHALMERQLGAPVSLAFATAVASRTGGNPLYVREVVGRVRAAGAATSRRGVWVLSGAIPVLDVRDLLVDRVEELPGRVRFALELLAVAGEMPLHDLIDAVGEATVNAGEVDGVVRIVEGIARPGHPLLRDAALSGLPEGRRVRVHETLLRITALHPQTPVGAARRVLWRLAGRLDIDVDELLEAAELVYSTSVALCRQLAAAAAARPLRGDQTVRLAALWVNLGDADSAEQVLQAAAAPLPPGLDVAALGLRGFAAWIVHDRPAAALELLESGVERYGPDPMLQAQRASALWRLGRMTEASTFAETVALDPASPQDARGVAAAILHTIAAAKLDVDAVAERQALVAEILRGSDRSFSAGRGTFAITVAGRKVLFDEDVDWAESSLRGEFTAALERGEEAEAAQYGFLLGWSLALRGRPQEAIGTMPEFLEVGGPWAVVNGGRALPCYIRALVAADHLETARQELERLRATPIAPMFAAEVGLAEVDLLAAEGRRPAALERARHHRAVAIETENEFCAVALAWAELLLGARSGPRVFAMLTRTSRIPLHLTQGAFALAIGAGDVDGAVRAVRDLLELGLRWHALEAVSVAAGLAGRTDAQNRELEGLWAGLTEGQPHVVTRALPPRFSGTAAVLTRREREVGALAAQGLTDREIADRLVLSVRTVETHVAHVFAKTGLHRREDLAALL